MSVSEGFKQTEVGVIPQDWSVISAADACQKIQDGTHFSPKIGGNDYLYVTSKNIRNGFLDFSTAGRIDKKQHDLIYKRCDVKRGDILFTKDGANTGNAAINILQEEFSLLSSVAFLRVKEIYDTRYFLQQILSSEGQKQIQEAMSGNAITRLTLEKINKLAFPLPPTKAEQTAIAAALSDMDALIEGVEKLLEKKRWIKQGAMQELLRPKEGWEKTKLGAISNLYQPETISEAKFTDEGYLVYGANGIIGKYSRYNHEHWQTIITCRGSTCGTVNKTLDKVWITGNAMVVNIQNNKRIDKLFLFHLLKHQDFRSCITGSGQPQIVRSPLFDYILHLPKTLQEQIAIAAILSDMDSEIEELETQLVKYRQLKTGMMQELLTGKKRLV